VNNRLESIIEAVQELSPIEQLDLISMVSQLLSKDYPHLDSVSDFWKPRTLDEISYAQGTQPVTQLADLRGSFWPDDESADDLIDYVYQQRREDRSGEN
jgi:hypothetical protein